MVKSETGKIFYLLSLGLNKGLLMGQTMLEAIQFSLQTLYMKGHRIERDYSTYELLTVLTPRLA